MVHSFLHKILFILLVIAVQTSFGQCDGDNTFTGTTSSNWSTASNWSMNCIPSSFVTGKITIAANCVAGSSVFSSLDGGIEIIAGVSFTDNTFGNLQYIGVVSGEGTFIGDIQIDGGFNPGASAPPPPTTGTVTYGGQTYNTILMPDGRWWMAENLNIGTMINGTTNMTNNGTIEKYCYNNNAANCATYGGLYQWNEMMQYVTTEGAQGICPTGWHVPSEAEWDLLVNSLPSPPNTDQGSRLSSNETLWTDGELDQNQNFGTSGFSSIPGGLVAYPGIYGFIYDESYYWTSNGEGNLAVNRAIFYDAPNGPFSGSGLKTNGGSVRCIQD
ncbi:MAG: hypothetical protein RLZZ546_778 [Bacteroidota bacterium]|jgi:uncharacterized protein (TIGR02145 family)